MAGRYGALGTGAEFDLIRRFLRDAETESHDAAVGAEVLVGPGDDCAIIRTGTLAISVDLAIEDVHFRRAWLQPQEIGYRATAAALSDLAAVAAVPFGVLVSLAVAPADRDALAPGIVRGARAAARAVGAEVIGGDVTRARDALTIDVVVLGRADHPVLRSGAHADDELWVTGRFGAAAAAVAAWHRGTIPEPEARAAFAHPRPRTAEAAWLKERGVLRALIDVSDGIVADAGHIAAASGVRIRIEAARVPVHPALHMLSDAAGAGALDLALTGGDDYELLFTARPATVAPLVVDFEAHFGVPLTRIGTVTQGDGVVVVGADGVPRTLERPGYDHFREDET